MNLESPTNTRLSRTIFALLFVIPILSVLLYGSTDVSALIPLSVLTFILGGIWIVRSWRAGQLDLNSDSIQLPILGLVLLGSIQLLPLGSSDVAAGTLSAAASNALSLDPFSTKIFIVRLIGYVIFFAAALTFIDSENRYRKAILTILVFGGALAFIGILQKLASPDAIYGVRKHPGAVPFGPYINQHHFASLMVLLSGLAIAHLLGRSISTQVKLLVGISAGIMAVAVPMTSSRGAMISYVAMLGVSGLAWFYGKKEKVTSPRGWFPLAIGGAVAATVALGSVVLLGSGDSLLRGIGLGQAGDDISSGRLYFWNIAWKIFTSNPILGAGLDAFGVAFTRFDTQGGLFRVEQAHNEYLQMLADGGVIGLCITIAFLVLLVKKAAHRIRNEQSEFLRTSVIGCLAGSTGIVVHSAFDFPLRTAGNAYCFLLIVAVMLAPVTSRMFDSSGREP